MIKAGKDDINLLPREEKERPGRGAPWLMVALPVLFILGWAGVFGWQTSEALGLKKQEGSLVAKKETLLREMETLTREVGAAATEGDQQKAALINSLLQERVLWSEVFKQFSLIVPKGLWFDNVEGGTTGKAEIRIKGGAFNYLSVAEMMLAMEKSAYFEKPQLLYAQKAVVQGQDVIGFEILCLLKKRGGAR